MTNLEHAGPLERLLIQLQTTKAAAKDSPTMANRVREIEETAIFQLSVARALDHLEALVAGLELRLGAQERATERVEAAHAADGFHTRDVE
jgi:uncharacterized protein YkwD